MSLIYTRDMTPTVQVRDLDPEILALLKRAAVHEGLSLSAYLRRELTTIAERATLRQKLGRERTLAEQLGGPRPGLQNISTQDFVDVIREMRGPIP